MTRLDYAIVGAGLSGLAIADQLHRSDKSYVVLEARERLGGRAWSRTVGRSSARYDVGPAWFWPGQAKMHALVQRLQLRVFEQFAQGNLVAEDGDGRVRRDLEFSTMAGALRIDGGISTIIEGLAATLDPTCVHTSAQVTRMRRTDDAVEVQLHDGEIACLAKTVIVTAPPRLVGHRLGFEPPLCPSQARALATTPTWMAGHAKAVAVYDEPFWRDAGLSGDGVSRRGPLVELHDASPADAREGALFGFFGVPAGARAAAGPDLRTAVVDQLTRLFGERASTPKAFEIVDWAQEVFTAVPADFDPPRAHPDYGLPAALRNVWDGQLRFASSETAASEGGLLEGALQRAAAVLR